MKLCIDIEANALVNPTEIWCIVCKDLDTGYFHIFREVTSNEQAKTAFLALLSDCTLLVGHHLLGYDLPVLQALLGLRFPVEQTLDTLVVSKLADYSRPFGHSIEAYGIEYNFPKGSNSSPDFFNRYSQELEDYCVRDVDICERVYHSHLSYINSCPAAIALEQQFQFIVNDLHDNGFSFNTKKAEKLLEKVTGELSTLDREIEDAFPAKLRSIREITPRLTQHGTLNRADFRWIHDQDLSEFNGGPFCRCEWENLDPSSHKQIINVLAAAGWSPTDKTQTHIDTERELNKLKYSRDENKGLAITSLRAKMETLKKYGWKISETNLATLPPGAPAPAKTLAKRILYESRRRTLTEWLGLVTPLGRIHGSFYGIGAWTHRMAHKKPNTANIPNEFQLDGSRKLLGKELRSLWQAPRNRLLVGVDAEGIQLRIFAHYIDDAEFTRALVEGKKDDKTDPHSLNQKILGGVCKSRAAAKRFIYALLLGAGLSKLSQILECSGKETEESLERLLQRYAGFRYLKEEVIPKDARRGYFIGLDGREVSIPSETMGGRKHLAMSGYLQNGESVVMKKATCRWYPKMKLKYPDYKLVNFVHDEWQGECRNNMEEAIDIAQIKCDSLREVGEELGLKCPLAGSFYNDDHHDYTIGTNWSVTH